jgi:hypothetical protein
MEAFFRKIDNKKDLLYQLKYNLPINCEIISFSRIKQKYYHRLEEILLNCNYFTLFGKNLKYLPDNINNPKLTLHINHNKLMKTTLPENWNINKLEIYSNNIPKIPTTFKYKIIVFI